MSDPIRVAQAELINIAAELITGKGYPSHFGEDHPARRSRSYWMRQLETVDAKNRALGFRVKAVYDKLQGVTSGDG